MIGSSFLVFSNLYQITKNLRNFRTSYRFFRIKFAVHSCSITIDNTIHPHCIDNIYIIRIDACPVIEITIIIICRNSNHIAYTIYKILTRTSSVRVKVFPIAKRRSMLGICICTTHICTVMRYHITIPLATIYIIIYNFRTPLWIDIRQNLRTFCTSNICIRAETYRHLALLKPLTRALHRSTIIP